MENKVIKDEQITASSQWSTTYAPKYGRLNIKKTSSISGAWTAAKSQQNANQWLQIELGNQQTKVTRVATQGSNGYSEWVTSYKLQYSRDGVNFQFYKEQGQTTDKVRETSSTGRFICISILKKKTYLKTTSA